MKNDHRAPLDRYHSIHAEDHDDSVTDVEETLDLNEKDYMHHSERPKANQVLTALKSHRWLVDTFLLLVVIALLLEKNWAHCSNNHFFEGAGDVTGFAPQFSQQVKSFSPDPGFVPENMSEFFSEETRKKWLDLVPKGLGYLDIKNPKDYDNLPTPLDQFTHQFVVTTSMTHQLHCLYSIAGAYSALMSDKSRLPTETWHISHCFDYLRQGIMCAGDVALEGEQTTFPRGFDGSDGWDAKHVCKDYNQVLDYLKSNRANDEVWI
ncbi:Uu.00g079600.m01.CDS01 [Anthostomella pinea]|uniref:Uu.00g079600.m01.CDS01 n=1 Tax=Anthostomella pinea TaxID=933095 RepID=A0AAI8VKT0_9PEZI|nr:Uu.00g079600.m01.CDS01 [Anthostomella pinea]